jgi:hypothetical protein
MRPKMMEYPKRKFVTAVTSFEAGSEHVNRAVVLIAGYFGFVCALAHLAREMLNQFSGVVMELEPNKPEEPVCTGIG